MLLGIISCSSEKEELILGFDAEQLHRINRMTDSPKGQVDPSNQYDGNAQAISFGETLYFSEILSPNQISCATCHDPDKGFSDNLKLSEGVDETTRHAPHLYGMNYLTWFFWDGRCDSLWCQAISPLEAPNEMNSSRVEIAHVIARTPEYLEQYEEIFGAFPNTESWPESAKPSGDGSTELEQNWDSMSEVEQYAATEILVNIAKAIAAYESTISIPNAPIDDFLSLFSVDPEQALSSLSQEERLGLQLFVGEGNCHFCHSGPLFTNGEFHNIGLGSRDWLSDTDLGRYQGIEALSNNPFNRAGIWSDSLDDPLAKRIDRLLQTTEQIGQFKVPSLRNIRNTAPYMHGGHFDNLEELVIFYSTISEESIQGHREEMMLSLGWEEAEVQAMIAFLEML